MLQKGKSHYFGKHPFNNNLALTSIWNIAITKTKARMSLIFFFFLVLAMGEYQGWYSYTFTYLGIYICMDACMYALIIYALICNTLSM